MRRSRLSQKLAELERDRGRRAASAGYKPWIYVDPGDPHVTLPDGTKLPTEVVDEAWQAAHPQFRYIEIGSAEPRDDDDDEAVPPGLWTPAAPPAELWGQTP